MSPLSTRRGRGRFVGPDKWLCVEQKVLMSTDAARAREVARQTLAFYMPLPNYRNNWMRLGFSEQDLADGGSERFLDAMVAWGDASVLQQRIQAHFDAGASHVCIQALRAGRTADAGLARASSPRAALSHGAGAEQRLVHNGCGHD